MIGRLRAWLGRSRAEFVRFEPNCMVGEDEGAIVRHAAPLDARARQQLREQAIARLRYDPAAVFKRERRLALARPNVSAFRRRG